MRLQFDKLGTLEHASVQEHAEAKGERRIRQEQIEPCQMKRQISEVKLEHAATPDFGNQNEPWRCSLKVLQELE